MTELFGRLLCAATAAAMALLAPGCKSSGGSATPPTGVPEVTLRAKTAGEVEAVAREFFFDRGYVEAASRHVYEVVFDKPSQSRRSGRALRVRLRLYKQTNDTWRLVGTPMGVEAWRSDLESELVRYSPSSSRSRTGWSRAGKRVHLLTATTRLEVFSLSFLSPVPLVGSPPRLRVPARHAIS